MDILYVSWAIQAAASTRIVLSWSRAYEDTHGMTSTLDHHQCDRMWQRPINAYHIVQFSGNFGMKSKSWKSKRNTLALRLPQNYALCIFCNLVQVTSEDVWYFFGDIHSLSFIITCLIDFYHFRISWILNLHFSLLVKKRPIGETKPLGGLFVSLWLGIKRQNTELDRLDVDTFRWLSDFGIPKDFYVS